MDEERLAFLVRAARNALEVAVYFARQAGIEAGPHRTGCPVEPPFKFGREEQPLMDAFFSGRYEAQRKAGDGAS